MKENMKKNNKKKGTPHQTSEAFLSGIFILLFVMLQLQIIEKV